MVYVPAQAEKDQCLHPVWKKATQYQNSNADPGQKPIRIRREPVENPLHQTSSIPAHYVVPIQGIVSLQHQLFSKLVFRLLHRNDTGPIVVQTQHTFESMGKAEGNEMSLTAKTIDLIPVTDIGAHILFSKRSLIEWNNDLPSSLSPALSFTTDIASTRMTMSLLSPEIIQLVFVSWAALSASI